MQSQPDLTSPSASFNGAGMFLSRKCAWPRRQRQRCCASMGPGCFYPGNRDLGRPLLTPWHASMGPGCFYPGNEGGTGKGAVAAPLQWGRDVSIPEIRLIEIGAHRPGALQWGRDVSIPEITGVGLARSSMDRFNGAGMFLSRKCKASIALRMSCSASMGPGCFYPGNRFF